MPVVTPRLRGERGQGPLQEGRELPQEYLSPTKWRIEVTGRKFVPIRDMTQNIGNWHAGSQ